MSYDFFFFCPKTTAGKIHFNKPILGIFSKNSSKFHFEGYDGEVRLQSDVLHQLKLRLATLSGGNNEEGA